MIDFCSGSTWAMLATLKYSEVMFKYAVPKNIHKPLFIFLTILYCWVLNRCTWARLFNNSFYKDFAPDFPVSKVNGANVGPTWALSAPDGPHVGPMNLATWVA